MPELGLGGSQSVDSRYAGPVGKGSGDRGAAAGPAAFSEACKI